MIWIATYHFRDSVMTQQEADASQHWKGMSGEIAWHIVWRHADGWNETSMLMESWLRANGGELTLNRKLTGRAHTELELLRSVYESARRVMRFNGVDPRLTNQSFDEMVGNVDKTTDFYQSGLPDA